MILVSNFIMFQIIIKIKTIAITNLLKMPYKSYKKLLNLYNNSEMNLI